MTWEESRDKCSSMESHLVVINSRDEMMWLIDLINNMTYLDSTANQHLGLTAPYLDTGQYD